MVPAAVLAASFEAQGKRALEEPLAMGCDGAKTRGKTLRKSRLECGAKKMTDPSVITGGGGCGR